MQRVNVSGKKGTEACAIKLACASVKVRLGGSGFFILRPKNRVRREVGHKLFQVSRNYLDITVKKTANYINSLKTCIEEMYSSEMHGRTNYTKESGQFCENKANFTFFFNDANQKKIHLETF